MKWTQLISTNNNSFYFFNYATSQTQLITSTLQFLKVSVDDSGVPFVVDTYFLVYYYSFSLNNFVQIGLSNTVLFCAKDIAVGGNTPGSIVYISGCDGNIYTLTGSNYIYNSVNGLSIPTCTVSPFYKLETGFDSSLYLLCTNNILSKTTNLLTLTTIDSNVDFNKYDITTSVSSNISLFCINNYMIYFWIPNYNKWGVANYDTTFLDSSVFSDTRLAYFIGGIYMYRLIP